ncbi:SDR family oxidoreductase [Arenibaculum sp.]|uniref:SDR family oxidoreductase n=1 Tax=Arenibaculum sp. TaxID=2865862 RepID=UPI002E15DC87|nr:SDR family oxidoreductase [Arenibaculum sp.]
MTTLSLDGRTAIVTGSTRGIGTALARRLHGAGAAVVVTGLESGAGEDLAAELGARALFVPADLRSDEAIDACIARALDRFGRLDILVNNACHYPDRGLDATRAEWLETLNVNLVGAAVFTAKAAAVMTAPGGVVVNLGSVGGKFGTAGRALYPASKAGLVQFTRNAAVTLAPRGIRVLAVSPGWTWTPALAALAGTPERADAVGRRLHPAGRAGRAEDVADAVLFACSDLAGFMTGTEIPVDGGYSILGPDQGRPVREWFSE